ncbi:hypothetical protein [Microbacterium helvum]|nr:hypothetical protein [Microbacterium helvum]
MTRPAWARRDPRPAIAIAAGAVFAAAVVGVLLLVILLGAGGQL